MKAWTITEAEAQLTRVLDAAQSDGPQVIERREGAPSVVVSQADWKRLVGAYAVVPDFVLDAPFAPDDISVRRPARILGSGE